MLGHGRTPRTKSAPARSTCNIPIDLPAFPAPPCSRNLGSNEPCQAAGGAAAHAVAARWGPRTTAQASDLPRRGGHGTGVRVPGRAHPARSPGRGRLRHAARHEERPLEKGGEGQKELPDPVPTVLSRDNFRAPCDALISPFPVVRSPTARGVRTDASRSLRGRFVRGRRRRRCPGADADAPLRRPKAARSPAERF